MVPRYNSITTNKTFIELRKIKIYAEDVETDEQEHEINALLVQLPFATLQMQSLPHANCLISESMRNVFSLFTVPQSCNQLIY